MLWRPLLSAGILATVTWGAGRVMDYETIMQDDGRWFISRIETTDGGVKRTEALDGDYDTKEDALAAIEQLKR